MVMKASHLKQLLADAPKQRLLCIGDVMLDNYVYGAVSRVSPEAPVPVLEQESFERMPGGAANTARNIAALGARTRLVGVIGTDDAGAMLVHLLDDVSGIDALLLESDTSTTTLKTRYVASGQQLMRVDQDMDADIPRAVQDELAEIVADACAGATAVLVSDYAKGVVSAELISVALKAAHEHEIPVIVDPKGDNISRYGPVDLIKPNASELSAMTGMPVGSDAEVEAALEMALELGAAKAILVTRAEQGMSYVERGSQVHHCKGEPRSVYDVSGAGDTTLAALGVALSAGRALEDASAFALLASGLAVEKAGTTVLTPSELLRGIDRKLSDVEPLLAQVGEWRTAGLRVGFTNGCFDILHPGHLHVLEEARRACDRLIVGLNTDAAVKRLKGDTRPIHDEAARAQMLSGLSSVDRIVMFDTDTPADLIEQIQPDVLAKGGDYTEETIVGAASVRERGGEVIIVPLLEGFSTSLAIEKAGGEA